MQTNEVHQKLLAACGQGHILASSYENCIEWLNPNLFEEWIIESITELVEGSHWSEINDRFYKTITFGTGGMRGRTIGGVVTQAEQGNYTSKECPEHTAVGANCMNDFNVRRATMGLVAYIRTTEKSKSKPPASAGSFGAVSPKPKTPKAFAHGAPHVVFAHDTRHFSRYFAELAAKTVIECGGQASLFESGRSTPELSFAVRYLGADAGVVITASHNPPHDNGFKAYFNDGAQVIEPHASGIIREIKAVPLEAVCRKTSPKNKEQDPSLPPLTKGRSKVGLKKNKEVSKSIDIHTNYNIIGKEIDSAYQERLRALILEPQLVQKYGNQLKVVYSALHGTGAKMIPGLLQEMEVKVLTVAEQMQPDGQFPTVRSPNPENAEALNLSIQLAEKENADLVLATDPDADRMGVAVRNHEGKMELLNGNQIGSLFAHYRLERLFAQKVLNPKNQEHARLIKTVVTTDFQKAIAQKFDVPIVETLTGFKYIGEKLRKYEEKVLKATKMDSKRYRALPEREKRDLLLQHSAYYVCGGEESYGYSASDFVRDKDANAACLMFTELAVYAKSKGQTVLDYLDAIYAELGVYKEKLGQIVYEGAEGAAKIQKILRAYEKNPPAKIADLKVVKVSNYAKEDIRDSEGDLLPKELLFFVELEGGARYAVRGSGTEPKIKFYLFACEKPPSGKVFKKDGLIGLKQKTSQFIDHLWKAIEEDAQSRAEG